MWIICKGVQDPIKKQITSEYILIQITKYLYTALIAYRLMAVYNSYWVRSNVSLWRRLWLPLSVHIWRPSCKKGVYRFLANFHFFQDQANFSQTDFFWHETHCSTIVFVDLRFFLQKKRMQKTQFSSGDLLFNEKQKKRFVSLSFLIHIITQINYCCFVNTSD